MTSQSVSCPQLSQTSNLLQPNAHDGRKVLILRP